MYVGVGMPPRAFHDLKTTFRGWLYSFIMGLDSGNHICTANISEPSHRPSHFKL